MAKSCVLKSVSKCNGGLSREHYISASVLRVIFEGENGFIEGTTFASTRKPIVVKALTAKTLCKTHNSALSPLDNIGRDAVTAIKDAQKEHQELNNSDWERHVSGELFERWLLKVAFGMWAGGIFAKNGLRIPGLPPTQWGNIVTGTMPFPAKWGMFFHPPSGPFMTHPTALPVVPRTRVDNGKIVAVHVEITGLPFTVVMGVPDNPISFGAYRRAGVALRRAGVSKRLIFDWPTGNGSSIIVMDHL